LITYSHINIRKSNEIWGPNNYTFGDTISYDIIFQGLEVGTNYAFAEGKFIIEINNTEYVLTNLENSFISAPIYGHTLTIPSNTNDAIALYNAMETNNLYATQDLIVEGDICNADTGTVIQHLKEHVNANTIPKFLRTSFMPLLTKAAINRCDSTGTIDENNGTYALYTLAANKDPSLFINQTAIVFNPSTSRLVTYTIAAPNISITALQNDSGQAWPPQFTNTVTYNQVYTDTLNNGQYILIDNQNTYDIDKSFDVTISILLDDGNTTYPYIEVQTITAYLNDTYANFALSGCGKGASFGGISNSTLTNPMLESYYPIHAYNKLYVTGGRENVLDENGNHFIGAKYIQGGHFDSFSIPTGTNKSPANGAITITETGFYIATMFINWGGSNNTNERLIFISKNSTGFGANTFAYERLFGQRYGELVCNCAGIEYCQAGDTIFFGLHQNSGSTLSSIWGHYYLMRL